MARFVAFFGSRTVATATATTIIDVAGQARGGRRRHRNADEELTEAEVQFMFRKLAELKKAKSEREKEKAAKELEVALAQAAQDEEAAAVITDAIEEQKPEVIARSDYRGVMQDVGLLSSIIKQLEVIARNAAKAQREEDDDIEVLMLSQ